MSFGQATGTIAAMNFTLPRWMLPGLLCALLPACDAVRALPAPGGGAVLEVSVFEGGYGIYWHQKIAAQYTAVHQRVEIDLWGDPRVIEKVKPRILRGTPPDLLLVHDLPAWQMIAAEKLLPFDEALAQPAYGSEKSWGELFVPGTLDLYKSDGHVYGVPSAFGAWACWYDARLFREHGWAPPATWEDFTALCDQMLSKGIAPLAYQGKYPVYGWWTFTPLVQRCGGLAALNRINALEPGAFSHPDVVRAAGLLQELGTKYMQKGALAMTHMESQHQFLSNEAAMIFCGLWLYNEMKEVIPDGFEMRCFNVPAVNGGKGNPQLFSGEGTEYINVPTDSRFPALAFDFARYMVSPLNAPDMGRTIGVISPLKGATPRESLTPPLQSAWDMINNAEGIFTLRLHLLLLEWRHQVMEPAITDLLRGALTPEAFCRKLDEGVQQALENPDLIVPPFTQYDPTAFGEAA